MTFTSLFAGHKPMIGMVHLLPLPETPGFGGDVNAIYQQARADAETLIAAGIDALIVENFGDEPYLIGEPTPAQIAVMASAASMIRRMTAIPLGINVQFNAYQAEIALAYACQAQFVRVEVFVDTVISAQGLVMPCSAQIQRVRRALGATDVQLWADIQTKYTHNLKDQPLAASAKDAQAAGADALIVTGAATGQATPLDAVAEVKRAVTLPVVVGSGTTIDSLPDVLRVADGAIVGSALKVDGRAENPVSAERAQTFMQAARAQRGEG